MGVVDILEGVVVIEFDLGLHFLFRFECVRFINCHFCSAAGELGGVLLPVVAELLLEPVLVSRGGKGDDCQRFEEFGIRTRCDEFYIKISVPRDVVDEGGLK